MRTILDLFKKPIVDERIRPVLFGCVPTIFFGHTSIQLFLTNEPDWFARLGSAMIAWAIVMLSIYRYRYSDYLAKLDRLRIFNHINQIKQLDELRTESLDLTFDIHGFQTAKLSQQVGSGGRNKNNKIAQLRKTGREIHARLESSRVPKRSQELVNEIRTFEKDYFQEAPRALNWIKFVWLLESVMLILGHFAMGLWRRDCDLLS